MHDLEQLRQRCIQATLYKRQIAKADSLCHELIVLLGYDPSEGQTLSTEERLLLLVNAALTACDTVPTPKPVVLAPQAEALPEVMAHEEVAPPEVVALEEVPQEEPKVVEPVVRASNNAQSKKKGSKKPN